MGRMKIVIDELKKYGISTDDFAELLGEIADDKQAIWKDTIDGYKENELAIEEANGNLDLVYRLLDSMVNEKQIKIAKSYYGVKTLEQEVEIRTDTSSIYVDKIRMMIEDVIYMNEDVIK